MSEKEFHHRWEYELRAEPCALWPLVSDTNRFNRDAGLPDVARRNVEPEPGRAARRRLRVSKFGVGVEWEEEPFEWVRPFRFGVVRRYRTGPVVEARVYAQLTEREGGGTRLVYDVTARPRGALGRAVIPVQVGRVSARKFAEVFRRYDALALAGAAANGDAGATASPLAPSERALLAALCRRLADGGGNAGTVARLRETIERGDELPLSRMRPCALADSWGAPRRDVLELFLKATRGATRKSPRSSQTRATASRPRLRRRGSRASATNASSSGA